MWHDNLCFTLIWTFLIVWEDVPLVEFMYLVFTHMPGESYRMWLMSLLLYLCYVFWALINSLVCWFWLGVKQKKKQDSIITCKLREIWQQSCQCLKSHQGFSWLEQNLLASECDAKSWLLRVQGGVWSINILQTSHYCQKQNSCFHLLFEDARPLLWCIVNNLDEKRRGQWDNVKYVKWTQSWQQSVHVMWTFKHINLGRLQMETWGIHNEKKPDTILIAECVHVIWTFMHWNTGRPQLETWGIHNEKKPHILCLPHNTSTVLFRVNISLHLKYN